MYSSKWLLRFGALALIFVVAGSFSLTNPEPAHASGSPFIGEIIMFGGNFAPRGWSTCEGQLLSISSNTALFSILGTIYGGDGRTTFGLPDMRGRVPVGVGTGAGLTQRRIGAKFGAEEHTLSVAQLPAHNHGTVVTSSAKLRADGTSRSGSKTNPAGNSLGYGRERIYSTGTPAAEMHGSSINLSVGVTTLNTGSGQAFSISQPSLVVNFIIAITGTYPSRS